MKYEIIGLVAIVLLIIVVVWFTRENLKGASQIAMRSSDPIRTFYKGREIDIAGMSQEDYYLQNKLWNKQGVLPTLCDEDDYFKNTTGYDEINEMYRPSVIFAETITDHA